MNNGLQWDDFLIIIANEYRLTKVEKEFFFKRFAKENLEKKDGEMSRLVMGNDSQEQTYRKRKSNVYKKFKDIINHDGKDKFPILLKKLEKEYQSRYFSQEITKSPLEPKNKVSNPFIPLSGVIDNSWLFFNREEEINSIFEVLNSGSSVAIIGEGGVGKSSLLKAIAQKADKYLEKPRKSIYIDLQNIQSDDDFYTALCEKVGIEISRGYLLQRNLKLHRILLLLDVVENISYDWFTNKLRSQLRGLASNFEPPLRLVIAASKSLDTLFPDSGDKTSPFENICIEEHLKPWNEKTIRNFINARLQADFLEPEYQGIKFGEDEILQIIESSKGYPRKVIHQCHELFKSKSYNSGLLNKSFQEGGTES
ncbi:ATPase [Trichodesmium erythraeum IMS101]|uniref:ATPase n=1 Tax=Trichodesmium erythraeum (strain IMS101) TaxID=203124 RepID=Q10WD5_TRIEI|nr:AAA family ATPase [Trichodesmium erythraeum GBRTRLIN201]